MDTRAYREPWQFQAGSTASLRLVDSLGVADLSGLTMTVRPKGGGLLDVAASNDDGARVFTLTTEQTETVEAAGGGVMSIRNAAGDEGIVGPVWASRDGTVAQVHEVSVPFGSAELTLNLSAWAGGGGVSEGDGGNW